MPLFDGGKKDKTKRKNGDHLDIFIVNLSMNTQVNDESQVGMQNSREFSQWKFSVEIYGKIGNLWEYKGIYGHYMGI